MKKIVEVGVSRERIEGKMVTLSVPIEMDNETIKRLAIDEAEGSYSIWDDHLGEAYVNEIEEMEIVAKDSDYDGGIDASFELADIDKESEVIK